MLFIITISLNLIYQSFPYLFRLLYSDSIWARTDVVWVWDCNEVMFEYVILKFLLEIISKIKITNMHKQAWEFLATHDMFAKIYNFYIIWNHMLEFIFVIDYLQSYSLIVTFSSQNFLIFLMNMWKMISICFFQQPSS